MEPVEFELAMTFSDASAVEFKIDNDDELLLVDFAVSPHFLRLTFVNPDDVLTLAAALQEWGTRFKAAREPEPYPVPRPKPAIDPDEMT